MCIMKYLKTFLFVFIVLVSFFTLSAQATITTGTQTTLYVNSQSTNTSINCGADNSNVNNTCPDIASAIASFNNVTVGGGHQLTIFMSEGTYTGNANSNIQLYNQTLNIVANNGSVVIDMTGVFVPYFVQILLPVNGGPITSADQTILAVINVTFVNLAVTGDLSGGIVYSSINSKSSISFLSCTFANITTFDGSILSVSTQNNLPFESQVVFQQSNFYNITTANSLIKMTGNILFVTITDNTFNQNQAQFLIQSSLVNNIYLGKNQFTNNTLASKGSLILIFNSLASSILSECVFTNNQAVGNGSLISAFESTNVVFVESSVTSNLNTSAFTLTNSDIQVLDSNFTSNTAPYNGQIVATNSRVGLYNSSFISNSAVQGGVVSALSTSIVTISGCDFSGNSASQEGGAIYSSNSYIGAFNGSQFIGNAARNGSILYVTGSSTINLNYITVSNIITSIQCQNSSTITIKDVDIVHIFTKNETVVPFISCLSGAECTINGGMGDDLCVAPSKPKSGLTSGQKAGIAIGVVLGVAILVIIIYVLYKRHHNHHKYHHHHHPSQNKNNHYGSF
ncbi:hypothetical protein DFA_08776 [Cavenderia fasciculata]|uniref:Pectin lyase-like family protein n=1 Tax=Cavenderia fasciculata TaxID=261658 RepID=F4Q475_CACFS|nr:uncharacterized protein DFA_08776 [Cavenderia fasciculata]EGG17777.1 hypothetical protein DFA_08776 [Cavenderia fasciculata]|eukprot:XP_004356261.1 hypothetical protein DFA_08776 [Cavenderia fasciculata]